MKPAVLLVFLLVFSQIVLAASDTWPTFRQDVERTGYSNAMGDLSEYLVRWTYTAPNGIFASPAIGDLDGDGSLDIVFGVEKIEGDSQKSFVAIDCRGDKLWDFTSRGGVHSSASIYDLDGDHDADVVFGTNAGELYALEGRDGKELWSYKTSIGAFRSSPLVHDVDSDNNPEVIIGSSNGSVYCLDGESGILEWRYQTGGDVSSSPALVETEGGRGIGFGSEDGNFYVLDGAGKLLFIEQLDSGVLFSTAAVGPKGAVIGTVDGKLHLINKGGELQKSFNAEADIGGSAGIDKATGAVVFGTSVDEDLHGVYVKYSKNRIYGLDSSMKKIWEHETDGWSVFSSPAIADIDRDGASEALIGSREGRLYAIEVISGDIEWEYLGGSGMYASPAIADLDGDGNVEIIVAYRYSNQIRMLDSPDRPDLVVEDVILPKKLFVDGDEVLLGAIVRNKGNIAADNVTATAYRRSEILDHPLYTLNFGGLEPGEAANATFLWDAALPEGELSIAIFADSGDAIRESDETNNWQSKKLLTDLSIGEIRVQEETLGDSRRRIAVDAKIKNEGRSSAKNVTIILSLDSKGNDILSQDTLDLAPDSTNKLSFEFESSTAQASVWLIVDPNSSTGDINSDNNPKRIEIAAMPAPSDKEGGILKPSVDEKEGNILVIVLVLLLTAILGKKALGKIKRGKEVKKGKNEEGASDKEERGDVGEDRLCTEPDAPEESQEVTVSSEDPRPAESSLPSESEWASERISDDELDPGDEDDVIRIGDSKETSLDPELEKLVAEKENVEKMIDIAKKKYYKRKLSEENYKDIVMKHQEKLIELEAKIQDRKSKDAIW